MEDIYVHVQEAGAANRLWSARDTVLHNQSGIGVIPPRRGKSKGNVLFFR
jgi:hypothetical protein